MKYEKMVNAAGAELGKRSQPVRDGFNARLPEVVGRSTSLVPSTGALLTDTGDGQCRGAARECVRSNHERARVERGHQRKRRRATQAIQEGGMSSS